MLKQLSNVLIQKCDILNKKNRIYPKAVLEKVEHELSGKTLPGCFIEDVDLNDFSINLSKLSHLAKNFKVKSDGIYCDIDILDTECGKVLLNMVDTISFVMVGSGNIMVNENANIVISDYTLFNVVYTDQPA